MASENKFIPLSTHPMLTRSQVKADIQKPIVDPQVLRFIKLLAMEEMPGWRPPAKKKVVVVESDEESEEEEEKVDK
ncbi:hypothetical protein B9Z55_026616 [Caenorhabditis nigoni]|uniref:Uncharacterized protein n=1 Tax=Caenorhabditis nigoni TaxID=1611254 RepID=A0A2G5T416_9PELO|nr:hypothetical protein B9Z55_026616 [Caenorhabditis nigoni]